MNKDILSQKQIQSTTFQCKFLHHSFGWFTSYLIVSNTSTKSKKRTSKHSQYNMHKFTKKLSEQNFLTISLIVWSQDFDKIKIFCKDWGRVKNWFLKSIVPTLVSQRLFLNDAQITRISKSWSCQTRGCLDSSQPLHVNRRKPLKNSCTNTN